MFQAFLKQISSHASTASRAKTILRLNSTGQEIKRAKEIRDVQLLGTIFQEPKTLENGSKILMIKTIHSDGFFKVHRAIVNSQKVLSICGNNLKIGQRVSIAGELQSTNYQNNENKLRQSFQIRVRELYATKAPENDESTAQKIPDRNHVTVLAHVISDIVHTATFSVFNLSSHHISRNPLNDNAEILSTIQVLVHDDDLRKLVKNGIQRRDRVLIHGTLNSKSDTDKDGRKRYNGHIDASHILKVDRFSDSSNNQTFE